MSEKRENGLTLRHLDRAIRNARLHAEDVAALYGRVLLEDLQSEMVVRAWEAWKTYDAKRGKSWENWQREHFGYAVRDVLREHRAERKRWKARFLASFRVLSFSEAAGNAATGLGLGITLEDVVGADGEAKAVIDQMMRDEWGRTLLSRLRARERRIVIGHYYEGVQKKDLAAELCITPTRLRQIEREAFSRLEDLALPPLED